MTTFAKLRIILLKSKTKSKIQKFGAKLRTTEFKADNLAYWMNLYFISEEKPQIGDWSINLNSPYEHKELCSIDNDIEFENYVNKAGNNCKKVVFTTDENLNLPLAYQSHIENYVEEYNNGNIVEWANVEHDRYICSNGHTMTYQSKCLNPFCGKENYPNFKVQKKYREINFKTSWNREEVESLLFQLAEHYAMTSTKGEIEDFNNWVKQNV